MKSAMTTLLSAALRSTRACSELIQKRLRARAVAEAKQVLSESQIVRDYGENLVFVDRFASAFDREEPFDYQGECRAVAVRRTAGHPAHCVWRYLDVLVPVALESSVWVSGPDRTRTLGRLVDTRVTGTGEAFVQLPDGTVVEVPLERLEPIPRSIRTAAEESRHQMSLQNIL
jgi:hypothetical protein